MSELPTGTVTLLLADVEGSTRLWETQPEEMTAAVARLDARCPSSSPPMTVCGRSSRARATASWSRSRAPPTRWRAPWTLQRAPLAPIRLRIGVHTGEVQLRDEGNYIGPTINRTARLRDLAHGGQTVLSGATERFGRRPAPGRCLADRPRHPPAARSAPPRAGRPAVPSRPAQRVPAAADSRDRCRPQSSGPADELRRPRSRDRRACAQTAGRQPAGHPDRRRRGGQDPAGGAGRRPDRRPSSATACGTSTWRRSPIPTWCRSRWPARSVCPTSRAARRWTRCCGSSATGSMLVVLDNCEHLLDASAALVVALLGAVPAADGAGDEP